MYFLKATDSLFQTRSPSLFHAKDGIALSSSGKKSNAEKRFQNFKSEHVFSVPSVPMLPKCVSAANLSLRMQSNPSGQVGPRVDTGGRGARAAKVAREWRTEHIWNVLDGRRFETEFPY